MIGLECLKKEAIATIKQELAWKTRGFFLFFMIIMNTMLVFIRPAFTPGLRPKAD